MTAWSCRPRNGRCVRAYAGRATPASPSRCWTRHGVIACIWCSPHRTGLSSSRIAAIAAALRREEQVAAVLDARREDETRRLLDAFGDAQIDVLVFKGAALAHTVYAAPHLRPRTDVDLLIDRESLDRADRVLAACGWHHPPEPEPETFAAQRHYVKQGSGRMPWLVDLHWRIANPRVFADALPFGELHRRAVTVPALGRAALTPSPVDALLLACIHRVAHHEDAD